LEYDQQIQALDEENARLKGKIVQIRERSQNVEMRLREENDQLVGEFLKLKRILTYEQSLNVQYREKAREFGQLTSKLLSALPNQPLQKPQSQAVKVLKKNSSTRSKIDSPGAVTSVGDNKSSEVSSNHISPIRDDEESVQTTDEIKEVNRSLNSSEVNGLDVDSFKKRKTSKNENEKKKVKAPVFEYTNLIVNYLPPDMDCRLLQKIFSKYGEIVRCKVVMDHKTGLSKGYGFVKFKTKEAAELALQRLDQWQIGGKVLKVAYARKSERGKSEHRQTNLFISNLDKNIETDDIKRVFSECGYVVQCRVLKDVRGVTRRIGFVRFDTYQNAMRAIKRFDGKRMNGSKSVIQVKFANIPKPPPTLSRAAPLLKNLSRHRFRGQPSSLLSPQEHTPGEPFLPNPARSVGTFKRTLLPLAFPQQTLCINISPDSKYSAWNRSRGFELRGPMHL